MNRAAEVGLWGLGFFSAAAVGVAVATGQVVKECNDQAGENTAEIANTFAAQADAGAAQIYHSPVKNHLGLFHYQCEVTPKGGVVAIFAQDDLPADTPS